MEQLEIQYFGHACFLLKLSDYTVIFDPYADGSVPGLLPVRASANFVFCSHEHSDHNALNCISILNQGTPSFEVSYFSVPHDDREGTLRGMNRITLLTGNFGKIAHLGDIGCHPLQETISALTGCDILFFPIGGYYTMPPQDIAELIQILHPSIAIPMHYRTQRSGYPVIGTLEDFGRFADIEYHDSSALNILLPLGKQNTKIIALKALNEE